MLQPKDRNIENNRRVGIENCHQRKSSIIWLFGLKSMELGRITNRQLKLHVSR